MDTFHTGLWRQPDLIVSLSDDLATNVLRYLLALACECQNMANIGLGRRTLSAMPADWLTLRIHPVAESELDLTDDWECRRLIELYSLIDSQLALTFAKSCAESANPEIAAAGSDYVGDPDAFATTAQISLGQPLP